MNLYNYKKEISKKFLFNKIKNVEVKMKNKVLFLILSLVLLGAFNLKGMHERGFEEPAVKAKRLEETSSIQVINEMRNKIEDFQKNIKRAQDELAISRQNWDRAQKEYETNKSEQTQSSVKKAESDFKKAESFLNGVKKTEPNDLSLKKQLAEKYWEHFNKFNEGKFDLLDLVEALKYNPDYKVVRDLLVMRIDAIYKENLPIKLWDKKWQETLEKVLTDADKVLSPQTKSKLNFILAMSSDFLENSSKAIDFFNKSLEYLTVDTVYFLAHAYASEASDYKINPQEYINKISNLSIKQELKDALLISFVESCIRLNLNVKDILSGLPIKDFKKVLENLSKNRNLTKPIVENNLQYLKRPKPDEIQYEDIILTLLDNMPVAESYVNEFVSYLKKNISNADFLKSIRQLIFTESIVDKIMPFLIRDVDLFKNIVQFLIKSEKDDMFGSDLRGKFIQAISNLSAEQWRKYNKNIISAIFKGSQELFLQFLDAFMNNKMSSVKTKYIISNIPFKSLIEIQIKNPEFSKKINVNDLSVWDIISLKIGLWTSKAEKGNETEFKKAKEVLQNAVPFAAIFSKGEAEIEKADTILSAPKNTEEIMKKEAVAVNLPPPNQNEVLQVYYEDLSDFKMTKSQIGLENANEKLRSGQSLNADEKASLAVLEEAKNKEKEKLTLYEQNLLMADKKAQGLEVAPVEQKWPNLQLAIRQGYAQSLRSIIDKAPDAKRSWDEFHAENDLKEALRKKAAGETLDQLDEDILAAEEMMRADLGKKKKTE